MSDLSKTTTNAIAGSPNRDSSVIYRFRMSLLANTNGPSSLYAPYYYAEHTVDLSFLNTTGLFPKVEVWRRTGTSGSLVFIKCPYTFTSPGTTSVAEYTKVQVSQNIAKSGGYTLGLTVALFTTTLNLEREYYITIEDTSIGATDSSLFPNEGTFNG